MAYSKSINLFLPTGSADGPIELEIEDIINKKEYTGMKRIANGNMIRLEKKHHEGIISVTEFMEAQEQKVQRSNMELGPDGNLVRKKERYQAAKE